MSATARDRWKTIADGSKSLLRSCRDLTSALQSGESVDLDVVVAACSEAESRAEELVSLSTAVSDSVPELLGASGRTRKAVSDLASAAKSLFGSPNSATLRSSFDISLRYLASSVRDLISCAEPLRGHAATIRDSGATCATTPLEGRDVVRRLGEDADSLLAKVQGGIEMEKFLEAAREFVESCRAVIGLARARDARQESERLREQGVTTLSLARAAVRNTGDAGIRAQLVTAVERLKAQAGDLLCVAEAPRKRTPSVPPAVVKPEWQYPDPAVSPKIVQTADGPQSVDPSSAQPTTPTRSQTTARMSSTPPPRLPERPSPPLLVIRTPRSAVTTPTLVVVSSPGSPASLGSQGSPGSSPGIPLSDLESPRHMQERPASSPTHSQCGSIDSCVRKLLVTAGTQTDGGESGDGTGSVERQENEVQKLVRQKEKVERQADALSKERAKLEEEKAELLRRTVELSKEAQERESELTAVNKLLDEQKAQLAKAQRELRKKTKDHSTYARDTDETDSLNHVRQLTTQTHAKKSMLNMFIVRGSTLDFAEWQHLLTKVKLSRKFSGSLGDDPSGVRRPEEEHQNVEMESRYERVVEAASALSAGLIDVMIAVATCVAHPSDGTLHRSARESLLAARSQLSLLMAVVRIKVRRDVTTGEDICVIEQLFRERESEIGLALVTGKLDDAVIAAAGIAGHAQQLILADLERSLYDVSSRLRLLLTQVLAIVSALDSRGPTTSYLLEMSATANSMLHTLTSLADVMETIVYLKTSETTKDDLLPALEEEDETYDVCLWDEILGVDGHTAPQWFAEDNSSLRYATLNRLIQTITSHKYNNNDNFVKAFVMTSSSFTTPSKLLGKLLERYDCPKTLSASERQTIQMRVAVLLKHWIETQFHALDDRVISTLRNFVEQKLAVDGYGTLAALLRSELEQKESQRARMARSFLVPPTDVFISDEKKSPVAFVLAFNEAEIARQLTLIDSRIFAAIDPKELLDLAWNRPKLQHRAPHVRELIRRANLLGYWICHLVVCAGSHVERVAVVSKLMRVAAHLHDFGNYNSLMAFIAGFNLTVLRRLQRTMLDVDSSLLKSFRALEKLMSMDKSFKAYRQAVAQSTTPTVPYIGVYLNDLTFIEEGNPDTIDGLVNFEKRELVYRVIADCLHRRQSYDFLAVEPLYSFLNELPAATEKDLYEVSLLREPRASVSSSLPSSSYSSFSSVHLTSSATSHHRHRSSTGGTKLRKLP